MEVPGKVKKIIWRALHGVIPSTSIIASRHIKVSAECPICMAGAEDIRHLLFTCLRAKEVWNALGLSNFVEQAVIGEYSGSTILEDIMCMPKQFTPVLGSLKIQELIAVACWYIWWQRREIVKGESVADPSRTSFAINALTANFIPAASSKVKLKECQWQKPASGCYKLNTDAFF